MMLSPSIRSQILRRSANAVEGEVNQPPNRQTSGSPIGKTLESISDMLPSKVIGTTKSHTPESLFLRRLTLRVK